MIYYKVEKNEDGIFLIEENYNPKFLLKTETVFSQCNGYFGIRASYDSKVIDENRGMFVSGLYNKAYKNEVTELVNCPDITEVQLIFNEEKFSIDTSELLEYKRALNVLTGELTIHLVCKLKNGLEVKISSSRFASYHDRHLFCQNIKITPLNRDGEITIVSGINGQITNSGVSQFKQIDSRVYDKKYMSMMAYLTKDKLSIMNTCVMDPDYEKSPDFALKRRSIYAKYKLSAKKNQEVSFTKYNYIKSSQEINSLNEEDKKKVLDTCIEKGYDVLLKEHRNVLNNMWKYAKIDIKGTSLEEETAICFAQYHLFGMTPYEDMKLSVAAKGLTGEGYKGHVFWDTEIFILPFFLYTFPQKARNLLEFRYHGLAGARAKAIDYGYEGAMFPWEVARDGDEQTPLYAALNIHTGKANKVWSGIKEHHVTADIVYAMWKYYTYTNDERFMLDYGYQVIFEAAIFWYSRASYNEEKKQFEILDIIGPDEYTEHIDNNAYTNYMAYFCVKVAKELANELKTKNMAVFEEINRNLQLETRLKQWKNFLDHIYLPTPNQDNIIPQDDTFLSKKMLENINYYKQCYEKQAILLDYSRDEVVDMQVLKQADVVMLLNLFPHLFSNEVVKENVIFYENRTVHDSSLSYCAHVQALANIGETDEALKFFKKALEIDINDNPCDSTDGIHSASLGGIWSSVIFGFAGVSHGQDHIEISPKLPSNWEAMSFYINIKGVYVKISISKEKIILECERQLDSAINIKIYDTEYELKDTLIHEVCTK